MIILDTNIISELMRAEPDENVSRWISNQKSINLAVTAITIGEIHRGLSWLPARAETQGAGSFKKATL